LDEIAEWAEASKAGAKRSPNYIFGAGCTVKEAFQFAVIEIKIYALPGPLIPVLLERP
jgi:hypothetical protein